MSYKNYEGNETKPLTVGQLKQLLDSGFKDTDQVVIHTTSERGDEPLVLENQISRVKKEQGLWTVDVAVIYTLDEAEEEYDEEEEARAYEGGKEDYLYDNYVAEQLEREDK
tara:strand:+ start:3534 stop:3866 length:333 start_codon:yes stop_codon:yes gene_type:complete